MTTDKTVIDSGGEKFNEPNTQESIPSKAKFLQIYPNYFSRLTRYVHNGDMKSAIKTANELKTAATESGAVKIPDLIVSIKNALYEGNTKKAGALLDEINCECSRYFMKNSTDDPALK